jgi:hypothetical protein
MSDMEVFNVSFINFGSKLGYLVSIEYIWILFWFKFNLSIFGLIPTLKNLLENC